MLRRMRHANKATQPCPYTLRVLCWSTSVTYNSPFPRSLTHANEEKLLATSQQRCTVGIARLSSSSHVLLAFSPYFDACPRQRGHRSRPYTLSQQKTANVLQTLGSAGFLPSAHPPRGALVSSRVLCLRCSPVHSSKLTSTREHRSRARIPICFGDSPTFVFYREHWFAPECESVLATVPRLFCHCFHPTFSLPPAIRHTCDTG